MSAPQYHWHVQGVVGIDEEAKQHVVALAQRLHEFGHQTEAQEMELWHWLGHAAQLSEVEQRVVNGQQEMADEFDFINREIHQFG